MLYRVAIGECEQGISEMQAAIAAGASIATLQNVLENAEVLAQCPDKPKGIDRVLEILKTATSSG